MDESNSRATTEIGRVENQDVGARIKEIVKKKERKELRMCLCNAKTVANHRWTIFPRKCITMDEP